MPRPVSETTRQLRLRVKFLIQNLGRYGKKRDFVRDNIIQELYNAQHKTLHDAVARELRRLIAKGVIQRVSGALGFFEKLKDDWVDECGMCGAEMDEDYWCTNPECKAQTNNEQPT